MSACLSNFINSLYFRLLSFSHITGCPTEAVHEEVPAGEPPAPFPPTMQSYDPPVPLPSHSEIPPNPMPSVAKAHRLTTCK